LGFADRYIVSKREAEITETHIDVVRCHASARSSDSH
jgi:hypothetical protein